MRRWVWRVLLAALVLAALTVGVFAAPGDPDETWVNGVQLELNTAGTEWTVKKYDGETEEVVIPALHENKPVTEIAGTAFNNGTTSTTNTLGKKLNKVTIPGTVKTVSSSAFKDCDSLNTVVFQDYMTEKGIQRNATIETSAFEGCDGLTTLTLSCNILEIKGNAFKNCKHLSGVVIPWGVKKVHENAFQGCGNLQDITILDPVVDIDKAFNLDSTILKTVHAVEGSELYGKLANRLKASPGKLHGLTGNTEPEVLTVASCTNAGSIKVSFQCGGYTTKETVKETVTDPDSGKTTEKDVEKEVHHDCDRYGKNPVSETRPTSMLPHKPGQPSSKDSTCVEHGYKNKIDCTVCGTELSSTELPLIDHNYDEDSEVEEKELFQGHCGRSASDTTNTAIRLETRGLSMVTRKCTVCGYTPVCWKCQELILRLEEADAGLEGARKTLAEATAKWEAAKAAKERADAAETAAGEALTAAEGAQTEAGNAYKTAQNETAKAQAALSAAATDEEKEAARKALDEAEAKEEEARKASLAADRAVLERTIEKTEAEAAATEARTAYNTADGDKTAAEGVVNSDTTVSTAQGKLREHLADKTAHEECAGCLEKLADIRAAKSESAKKKAEAAYAAHKADTTTHKPEAIPEGAIDKKDSDEAPEHDWGEPEVPDNVQRPECGSGKSIIVTPKYTCKACKATKDGKAEILDAAPEHKLPAKPVVKSREEPTCTKPGKIVYEDYTCETCKRDVKGEERTIPELKHDLVHDKDIIVEATCTTPGSKTEVWVCSRGEKCSEYKDGKPYSEQKEPVITPAKGHTWGDFTPNEGQDMTPNETCESKEVTGKVKCTVCGVEEEHTLTIEGLGKHTWGEWKASEDGKTETRTCSVCGETETKDVAAPEPPDEPDDPDDPDDPDKPDKPTEPDTPKSYSITVVPGAGGAASASRSTAQSGDTVTLTISASSGYELDMIRAIRGGVSVVSLTDLGGGQYRFTMPADNVEIRVTFSKKNSSSGTPWASAPGEGASSTDPRRTTDVMPTQNPTQSVPRAGAYEQLFQDIPTNHWAAGEINWANQMGYMNGTAGRFNPDGNITHQQMWMVLARLTGNHPANMTEARRWAVEHSFADGSSPTGAVSRHQLVTALYRCAHLMGSANRNTTSLAGYPDSRTVPTVARDAFSWAVANGILGGTANGRLDPNGTLTRAQFAVILYRYSQRI